MFGIGTLEMLVILGICALFIAPVLLTFLLSLRGRQVKDGEKRVKCPYCAELILPDAKVCRYCKRDLPRVVDISK